MVDRSLGGKEADCMCCKSLVRGGFTDCTEVVCDLGEREMRMN